MDPCTCAEHAETYWSLVTDLAHWELEITIMIVFDGLVGAIAWPILKRYWTRHHHHNSECK